MKNYLKLSGIMLLALIISCASSGEAGTSNQNEDEKVGSSVKVDNPSISLADYLKRFSGVSVFGSGNNVKITVRGATSVHGNTAPLFVVDGVRYGKEFSRVQSTVSVDSIDSVRVLKGVEASSAYGLEGSAGVIEITTKKGN
jgi:TonB-dependent SusC/RagA subfamily outer membrane receptor